VVSRQTAQPDRTVTSWGRLPGKEQLSINLWAATEGLPSRGDLTVLPFGRGRSYGDSCLNRQGVVLATSRMDRIFEFDATSGTLRCEAGLSLKGIIDYCLPRGWFPPVVPGTQYVSVGGAIANDVHGKNHHLAGTFGRHVVEFELLRSDGSRRLCSPSENPEWFGACVGGLGLTGLITWARIALRRVKSALVEVEEVPFSRLEEFVQLSEESDSGFEYTVAWFDCYSYRKDYLRGIFSRARHVTEPDGTLPAPRPAPRLMIPFVAPSLVLSPLAVRSFNALYFHAKLRQVARRVRLESFLFPLDAIGNWNRLYGKDGFVQLQCVFPPEGGVPGVSKILQSVSAQEQGSFLAVLKRFGDIASPGLLSFPRAGVTLALDFQNRGTETLALLADCHAIVRAHGGRVYPAKDACMAPAVFEASFPRWRELLPYTDPRFLSDFWRRTAMALLAHR